MPIVVRHELIKLMQNAHKDFGKTEFNNHELLEMLKSKFPTLDTNLKNVGASISSMKQAGIVVDLGFVPGSDRAKMFGLAEIIDAETAPPLDTTSEIPTAEDFPKPVSAEMAATILRRYEETHADGADAFTETVQEVAEMAQFNANAQSDRKPREGTPEHVIMRLTKKADRIGEEADRVLAIAGNAFDGIQRLEKSLHGALESLSEIQNNQVRLSNDLGEAQLDAMKRLKDGVLNVVRDIALEISKTRADNTRVEENLVRMLKSVNDADEVDRNGYKRGFLDGFNAGRQQAETDADAIREKGLTVLQNLRDGIKSAMENDLIEKANEAMGENA